MRACAIVSKDKQVSIPIGFSGSLQRQATEPLLLEIEVSIPIGFSGSLQHFLDVIAAAPEIRFQSLSGFLVRCNSDIRQQANVYS